MPQAAIPIEEARRIAALLSCNVLDTKPEPEFDELTTLAAEICETPMALVSLVDRNRQWFKSRVGLDATETPRDVAFCAYAIHRDEPLIVSDAASDPRTFDNPLVTGAPFLRFYAGIPLVTSEGLRLGSLCVLDTKPRTLSAQQLTSLQTLAKQVVRLLERRRRDQSKQHQDNLLRQTRWQLDSLSAVTFALGLALTVAASWYCHRATTERAQVRFEELHEDAVNEIVRRVNLPIYGLKGARGVYASSTAVDRHAFAAYVSSRELRKEFPGTVAFSFMERVMRPDLERFVAAERLDGALDFKVHSFSSPTEFEDLYVVKYIAPFEPNRAAWGLDAGSEPIRRAALERAVLSGEPTVSGAVVMAQDSKQRSGFLQFLPVYRNGTSPSSPADRLNSLVGVLCAPVIIEEALAGIVSQTHGLLDFEIFDGDATIASNRIFTSETSTSLSRPGASPESDNEALTTLSSFDLGSRNWTVKTRTTPLFITAGDRLNTWSVGAGGVVVSLLLSAVVWSARRSRTRAVALAEKMTSDLRAAKDVAVSISQEVRAAASLLRRTGELARVGGWEISLPDQQLTWSDEVYRIHEIEIGTPVSVERAIHFYAPEARERLRSAIDKALSDGTPWDLELPLTTAKGRSIFVRVQGECVREDRELKRLCGAFQDITERKTAEEALRRTATHDKLTGLPNRVMLTEQLHACFDKTRQDHSSFAVLFMDFDRFKLTNDTLGHEAGDDLLKQIAGRLHKALEISEASPLGRSKSTVGRLGGDEFVVILHEIRGLSDATAVAGRLVDVLKAPYRILSHEVVSTASIGVVTSSPRYTTPEQMLRDADIAMYEAKLAGKARYVVFDTAMFDRVSARMTLESDLRGSMNAGELTLAYQPIVSLVTGEHHGVEALLRWNHPTRGAVSPGDFIAIAEETGLILSIGEWALRNACEQFKAWQLSMGAEAPKTISVNLSRKQLALRDLPQTISAILHQTGMSPECLHLEVTESAVMKDPIASKQLLQELRNIGVKIDMDDFGTGHSSLAMLHEFPLDVLKIDRSFVKNIDQGREFAAIVQAIAQLARNLGIIVVAEGIETAGQLALLQSLDCDLGQGYFFSRPISAAAYPAYLAAYRYGTGNAVLSDRSEFASAVERAARDAA